MSLIKSLKIFATTTYSSSFLYGTKIGYNFAMDDWKNIKKNNIQLTTVARGFQYLHTGVLTIAGGVTGCVFLTISPIIIPSFYILKNQK